MELKYFIKNVITDITNAYVYSTDKPITIVFDIVPLIDADTEKIYVHETDGQPKSSTNRIKFSVNVSSFNEKP